MQGGQFILNLVDFFGPQSIAFVLAIAEMVAVCWIYGKLGLWGLATRNYGPRFNPHIDLIAPHRYWSIVPRYGIYDWTQSGLVLANVLGYYNSSYYGCNPPVHAHLIQTT